MGILAMSHIQTKVVPALHPVGFQKVKIPKDIYARCKNRSFLDYVRKHLLLLQDPEQPQEAAEFWAQVRGGDVRPGDQWERGIESRDYRSHL